MRAGRDQPTEASTTEPPTPVEDEERAVGRPMHLSVRSRGSGHSSPEDDTELLSRPNSAGGYIKRKTSQLLGVVTNLSQPGIGDSPLAPMLASLVEAYAASDIATDIRNDMVAVSDTQINRIENTNRATGGGGELPDVVESSELIGRKRASWVTQFRILSGRAFKNLYRDPALLTAHYTSSIALACKSDMSVIRKSSLIL